MVIPPAKTIAFLLKHIMKDYNTITLFAIQLLTLFTVQYGIQLLDRNNYIPKSYLASIYSLPQLLTNLNPTECAFSEGM